MIEEKMYKIILLDLDNTLLNFDLAEKEASKKITHDYDINYNVEIYMNYKK
jgi:2-haloacid dehalogenase